jgi:nitrogen fixation protein FixH
MNWGYRIALTYILFVIFMLTMVISSFRYEVNLVAKDYYKQEIAYESEIKKMRNTNALKTKFTVKYNAENKVLDLQMPVKQGEGEIHLFRPADDKLDLKMPLAMDSEGRQAVPISNLKAGLWRIKINWLSGNKNYYVSEKFFIEPNGNIKIGEAIKLNGVKF